MVMLLYNISLQELTPPCFVIHVLSFAVVQMLVCLCMSLCAQMQEPATDILHHVYMVSF